MSNLFNCYLFYFSEIYFSVTSQIYLLFFVLVVEVWIQIGTDLSLRSFLNMWKCLVILNVSFVIVDEKQQLLQIEIEINKQYLLSDLIFLNE
jgi:hypothetical protein